LPPSISSTGLTILTVASISYIAELFFLRCAARIMSMALVDEPAVLGDHDIFVVAHPGVAAIVWVK
jgi:hypothetical protein